MEQIIGIQHLWADKTTMISSYDSLSTRDTQIGGYVVNTILEPVETRSSFLRT